MDILIDTQYLYNIAVKIILNCAAIFEAEKRIFN